MKNTGVRLAIMEKGLRHYELAERIGISQFTLCRWLQTDLNPEREQRIRKALEEVNTNTSNV